MKKALMAFLFVLSVAILCSCNHKGTYEDGYKDGYSDGYFDCEYNSTIYDDAFDAGYDIGKEDGYNTGYDEGYDVGYDYGTAVEEENAGPNLEYEGIHYARQFSEWSPEEALEIIDAYQNDYSIHGAVPSEEEYLDAIESLRRFYEYFYLAKYR